MNAKILAAGAALVLSLAACSDEPETPPTTTEPTTEEPTAADGELSEGLAEYLRIEAHAMDTLKENPESGSLFNELFSDFWSTGEQTDEVSRVVTEYVVKDAASYNYLESLILPALEDEIDHMTTMTFPAMERLEVPGV